MRARISRRGDGRYSVRLPEAERSLLASIVPQLRGLLTGNDPDLRRLFPPAYANDPDRDHEYQSLVHDELLERRLAALDTVEETLEASTVDEEQLTRWMGAVNDIRLVLGTKLDISEDMDEIGPADEVSASAYAVYDYLTWLLGQIVDALAGWGDYRPPHDPPPDDDL